jgi:hypothetical protein
MAKKKARLLKDTFFAEFFNRSFVHSLIFRNLYFFLKNYQELYSWLQKKPELNKIGTFLQFFHCVKPSYE